MCDVRESAPSAAGEGADVLAGVQGGTDEQAHDGALRQVEWGDYAPAIARWEAILGRPAPPPTDERGRLSPRFVEFLMGLPEGWVTDTPDLSRAQQLKILGNGIVPQQCIAALRVLLDREVVAA
jgi:DNA (cytosine-5)-methyltransferase 1